MPKISFDYEVVEKAENVAVVSSDGKCEGFRYEEKHWVTYRVLDCRKFPDGTKTLTKTLTLKAVYDLTLIEVRIGNPLVEEDIERLDGNGGAVTMDANTNQIIWGEA